MQRAIRKKVQSLSEVIGTHVVLDCKWIITVFYTQYRSPPPPPTPINVVSTKTHQTWREMGHNIEQGAGGLTFVEIQRFCGICPKALKLIVWKAMKRIFNFFELPAVLEYQFCENHIAFSITCLLNCIGICNVLTVLRLWSISLKCNTIQQYIINELIKRCEYGEGSMLRN
jgi:hypothetical protein